jgi:hypothetical protein
MNDTNLAVARESSRRLADLIGRIHTAHPKMVLIAA